MNSNKHEIETTGCRTLIVPRHEAVCDRLGDPKPLPPDSWQRDGQSNCGIMQACQVERRLLYAGHYRSLRADPPSFAVAYTPDAVAINEKRATVPTRRTAAQ